MSNAKKPEKNIENKDRKKKCRKCEYIYSKAFTCKSFYCYFNEKNM